MNKRIWSELLDALENATRSTKLRWTPTDRGGSFAAVFRDSTVVVQGVEEGRELPAALAAAAFAIGGRVVELRNDNGDTVAELHARPGVFDAGRTPKEGPVMAADDGLRNQIDHLCVAIVETYRIGESIAADIIASLRDGR